jgi:hypothetical protein
MNLSRIALVLALAWPGLAGAQGTPTFDSLVVTGAITAGSINAPSTGNPTPGAGAFTTLSSNGTTLIQGGTLSFTPSGGLSIIDAKTGTLLLKSGSTGANGLVQSFPTFQTAYATITGATVWSGSQTGGVGVSPLWINGNQSGTTTGFNPIFHGITIATDTLAANPARNVTAFAVIDQIAAGATGSRNGIRSIVQTAAATTNVPALVSGQFYATSNFSHGGTDTSTGAIGAVTAINPNASVSGTNMFSVVGNETNVAIHTGGSAGIKFGIQVVNASDDAVKATNENAGYKLASAHNTAAATVVGFDFGFQFNSNSQQNPMDPQGTMVGAIQVLPQTIGNITQNKPYLAKYGLDFSLMNFSQASGASIFAPGFAVDGTGRITFANGILSAVSGGIQLDTPNQIATAAVIATAGAPSFSVNAYAGNFWPGDVVYGPSKGSQYLVATTKVMLATVVAGGTGGTPGTATVTGTTGTGTPFQASVTVSAGGAITAVGSITVAGSYTVAPSALGAEPVTGAGLTGATLGIGMGIGTLTIVTPDVAAAGVTTYPNPVTLTGGSGQGATATLTWAASNALSLNPSGGAVLMAGLPTSAPATHCQIWANSGILTRTTCP